MLDDGATALRRAGSFLRSYFPTFTIEQQRGSSAVSGSSRTLISGAAIVRAWSMQAECADQGSWGSWDWARRSRKHGCQHALNVCA